MGKSPKPKKIDRPVEMVSPEAAPIVETTRSASKIDRLIDLMRRVEGAELEELMAATGWQAHSVRGAISGAVKRKLGLQVSSVKEGDMRVYRIVPEVEA